MNIFMMVILTELNYTKLDAIFIILYCLIIGPKCLSLYQCLLIHIYIDISQARSVNP